MSDFFSGAFVRFFTETIPNVAKAGWNKVVSFFWQYFFGPLFSAWYFVKRLLQRGPSLEFFTETIPNFFKSGWDKVIGYFTRRFYGPFLLLWSILKGIVSEDFVRFFAETIPNVAKAGWKKVVEYFWKYFANPLITAWYFVRDFFSGAFVRFFTETIPNFIKAGGEKAVEYFLKYLANPIIGILNSVIRTIGKTPIPTVSVGVNYFGPTRIPYPTFSVGSRPLSSFVNLPQIPLIGQSPTPSSVPDHEIRRLQNAPGANVPLG